MRQTVQRTCKNEKKNNNENKNNNKENKITLKKKTITTTKTNKKRQGTNEREYFNINCCGTYVSLFSSDEALTERVTKHQVHVRSQT